jgi:hypothetical protein
VLIGRRGHEDKGEWKTTYTDHEAPQRQTLHYEQLLVGRKAGAYRPMGREEEEMTEVSRRGTDTRGEGEEGSEGMTGDRGRAQQPTPTTVSICSQSGLGVNSRVEEGNHDNKGR